MAARRFRAAIVGMGGIHYRTYATHERTTVVAACDVLPDRIQSFTARYPLERTYADWREMIDRERPDILSVVTNGPSHAEITIGAAEAGVERIYCEKPMGASVAECQAMIDACQRNGATVAINHTRRWWQEYRDLARMIAEGIIGEPVLYSFTVGGWRLGSNGGHIVDLIRMLGAGNPTRVTAFVDQKGSPDPHGPQFKDPGGHGIIHFDTGAHAFIDQSEGVGVDTHLEIVGSIGRILVDDMRGDWRIRARQGADRDQPLIKYGLPLVDVPFTAVPVDQPRRMHAAVDELLDGQTPSCTGLDGKKAVEAIVAFHVSDQRGNVPVDLPLTGEDASHKYSFT